MGFSPFPCLYAEEGVWKEETEALGVRQEKAGEIGPSCAETAGAELGQREASARLPMPGDDRLRLWKP